ncbi:putative oxidoreductase [Acaryochloris thomasi RCC1774]|uniref:Putative oxidoreductase n=1 Tax=Acaryochloris thomasi RCC1774 TaxID=1764569 RepID=A0A2W1JQP3_9CYAN|nr:SDR family oxidoreductase [Acaryochloris thomasi]PZD72434.1 putative oxidoreductase [Acaryochloris thomasi RCC1774]
MSSINAPVVLITGCSSGIGRALALEFWQQGYCVYATARRVDAIASLQQPGLNIAQLDVTDTSQITHCLREIGDQAGKIDLLINNAGYAAVGPLLEMPQSEVQAQFATNVFAPLALIQQVAAHMIEQGSGTIVNIGSASGILVTPFAGAYCASKAALHALSEALRIELAPFNIRVVLVQTGAIQSNIGNAATERLANTLAKPSRYETIMDKIRARAMASQQNATSTETYAQQLVNDLSKEQIPAWIVLGHHSRWLAFLRRWLPQKLRDQILITKFGLNLLHPSPPRQQKSPDNDRP